MPPRKASARSKKLTPKAKQQDGESSTSMDANSTLLDSEIKDQELSPSEKETINQQEVEEAAHPVVEEEEMKPDIGVLNGNPVAVEGLTSGDEDRVLMSTEVEVTVKEESNTDVLMDDSLNVNTVDLAEKGEDATENGIVEGEQNEGGVIGNDSSQPGIASVAEMNSPEEETVAAQNSDAEALGNSNNLLVVNEGSNQKGEGEENGADDDSEDNKDEDPSVLSLNDTNKLKDLEIFIGGLDKGAVEDDLIEVFGKFGEIKAARIARKSSTKKSKGFAFIQYGTVEQAMNALSELKDGIEVRGKHVRVSIGQDKDTLYMGNICKTWTKEQVLETLKLYGIEHIEEIQLPDDPRNEGRTKGFALLNFSTHSNALEAFQRLRKPDAVFGRDGSAKVVFTQTSMHPNEEDLSQVKRVYVEGLTDAWNKERVEEICKQYGEIVEVKLFRNKRKYFGFVSFTSRESALACVEGINNAQIGEGEVKLKSNIAKPQHKDRLQKQGFSGGFMVQKTNKASPSKRESEIAKQTGPSKAKGHSKSKRAKRKGKTVAEEKGKALSESKNVDARKANKPQSGTESQNVRTKSKSETPSRKPNKPQSGTESKTVGTTSKSETPSRKRKNLPSKGEGRSHGGIEHGNSKRPSKKRRGNVRERQSNSFRKPERDDRRKDSSSSTAYYQGHAHGVISASKRHRTDMEPHAGYLEPVAGKQVQPYSGYLQPAVGIQNQPYARYREPAVWTQAQTHSGYLEPSVGIQGQPHAGYIQPAIVKYVHDPYDPRLRRDDGQGSSGYAYGGAGSTLPPYAPNYTTYAGYEGQGSAGYYQSSGAYALPRRAYY